MKVILNVINLAVFVLTLAACSVEQKSVPNTPPVMPVRQASTITEEGKLVPESFSIFLMPEWPTREQRIETKKNLIRLSAKLDQLMGMLIEVSEQEGGLLNEFLTTMDCRAVVTKTEECEDFGWGDCSLDDEMDWDVDNSAETQGKVLSCKRNYGSRQGLKLKKEEVRKQQNESLKMIFQLIDPEMPGKTTLNTKKVKAKRSSFVFENIGGRIEAKIELADFINDGVRVSSEAPSGDEKSVCGACRITDVFYDAEKKVLKFRAPEISKEDDISKPTGAYYDFVLERTVFLKRYVRFSGEVKYYTPDGKVRIGEASLYGEMK